FRREGSCKKHISGPRSPSPDCPRLVEGAMLWRFRTDFVRKPNPAADESAEGGWVSGSEPHNSSVEALSSELAQLREQQVATNEVLLAVARSDSDFELQPIFETVVEQAIRLCKADAGQIFVKEGDHSRLACAAGGSEEYRSLIGERQLPLGPGT